jgi:hypothetical protein
MLCKPLSTPKVVPQVADEKKFVTPVGVCQHSKETSVHVPRVPRGSQVSDTENRWNASEPKKYSFRISISKMDNSLYLWNATRYHEMVFFSLKCFFVGGMARVCIETVVWKTLKGCCRELRSHGMLAARKQVVLRICGKQTADFKFVLGFEQCVEGFWEPRLLNWRCWVLFYP